MSQVPWCLLLFPSFLSFRFVFFCIRRTAPHCRGQMLRICSYQQVLFTSFLTQSSLLAQSVAMLSCVFQAVTSENAAKNPIPVVLGSGPLSPQATSGSPHHDDCRGAGSAFLVTEERHSQILHDQRNVVSGLCAAFKEQGDANALLFCIAARRQRTPRACQSEVAHFLWHHQCVGQSMETTAGGRRLARRLACLRKVVLQVHGNKQGRQGSPPECKSQCLWKVRGWGGGRRILRRGPRADRNLASITTEL